MLYLIFSIVFAFLMGIGVIIVRMKAQHFPVNEKKIILPPFYGNGGINGTSFHIWVDRF